MAKKSGVKGQKKPIKAAVLGLGRSGWNIHIARMRNDPRFIVTAVTDPMADRRAQAVSELGCVAYESIDELLKNADADVIVNATPTHLHVETTLAAIKTGRNVILEKPVAQTTADARKMVNAAKKKGIKLFFHHNYRFGSCQRHLREVVESGLIGRLFEIKHRGLSFNRRWDWQTLKKFGGGLLGNHGTHFIDAIMYIMGDPVKEVFSDLKLVSDAGDAEDHIKVLLRTKTGIIADVEISTSCAYPEPMWTMLGSHGTLVSDGKTSTVKFFDPKKVEKKKADTEPQPERKYIRDELPFEEKTMPSESAIKTDFYDNIFEVMREKGKMFVTPESVLDVLAVLEKAASQKILNYREI